MVLWGIAIAGVAATGHFGSLPARLDLTEQHTLWFWLALGVLATLLVVLPFLIWVCNPQKCLVETTDDYLIIRTSKLAKRQLELAKIEKIFVEDNLATIFYRSKRGFPKSWMIERDRFRSECWTDFREALNTIKTQVRV
tara:strand:+ start:2588 stop:3004 length:417 start_codon:yes stop_codon:yes gene_type:complete